ncbi:MAG: RusA family crossover junction endodeoxyribonuclease [bacterium]|nr:RusA family crossover junction endodeoxyribonuclease [bacterium]
MTEEVVWIALPLPNKVLQPNETVGSIGGRMMKAAAIRRYRRLACEAVTEALLDSMPWLQCRVEAKFYFKDSRRRDQDNAMGSIKAAYDGIVDAGLVHDDDYERMKRGEPKFSVDKLFPRVELTISRLQ